MDHDEKMKKVNEWLSKQGLDEFKDSEFLVNGMRRIDADKLEITAFTNIYLNNDDIYSAQITFTALKR